MGAGPASVADAGAVPCLHSAHGPLEYRASHARLDPQPAEQPQDSRAERAAVVKTALRFRGVPYRYAGMSSRGIDCSGLISRVLTAHGIKAPHSSAALFTMGERVRFEDLRSGDLLFFVTRGKHVSHVGLYIGDGKFVHASSRSGGVIVSSVYETYYAKRLAGARRLF
jgi:cell wall-associated NlpC family hydrolase